MARVPIVHVEFQRVQTWLFTVPRLRAMVGANALLGEMLRIHLPELAREPGRGWTLAPGDKDKQYPSAHEQDPLKEHDDPAADAEEGILSRDGGHFEVQFTSMEGAEAFADAAEAFLREELPGLRYRIAIDNTPRGKSHVHLSTELPVLAPCEWTGRGLASANIRQGNEGHSVSLDVERRHEKSTRAEKGYTEDIASLLSAKTKLKTLSRPQELEELVGDGYLALIHADGNGVGSGVEGREGGSGESIGKRAAFFHRNRVLLRQALKKAIDDHCPETGQAPLIPLMLGGDDLLLVTRAEIALPFVVTLCKQLECLQKNSNDFKLTLGVGVVIAKHVIPIHQLHDVAEQLASSAKRRFRRLRESDEKKSVVDWAVYSTSWVNAPEEVRRRDWLRYSDGRLHVLSQRPVDVLGEEICSLQGLVQGATNLKDAPRSQLRYLVDQLPRGRALSELAFKELSKETSNALREEEIGLEVRNLWQTVGNTSVTALLDLVEIAEITRLGRMPETADVVKDSAHG